MTNVLYLSYDGLTDPLGQSQILPYLINLTERGYSFTIISAEKTDNYHKRVAVIEEIINKTAGKIDWQPITYTKKPPVLSTIWDIRQMRKKAFQLYKEKKFSIIHCRSYISALVGLSMKKRFPQVKFIFDMRGFWADERVDGGLWDLQNPLFKRVYIFFKQKEKAFLSKADYTIFLTHNAKDEIQSWKGLENTPVQVIPCCVDTDLFNYENYPADKQDFTISYLGSIGTWYLLDEMLAFFKRLLLVKPEAKFMFITTEPSEYILNKAKSLDIDTKAFIIQSAERKQVPEILAKSHLSIFFIKEAFSKKASSATKMGEILAMGIPVIANPRMGDHDYLFPKYTCGTMVNSFDDNAYDTTIQQIDELLKISPQTLRQTAIDYFSLKKGVDLYEEVYQKVSN